MNFDKIIRIVVIVFFFIGIGLCSSCLVEIPPDENAVLFKRFDGGLDKNTIYHPGTHIISPGDQLISYNITTQIDTTTISGLSKDSLAYDVEFTYRYRVKPSRLGFLHEEIGANYNEIVIIPALQNGVEEILKRTLSKDISTLGNKQIEDKIQARSKRAIEEKYLILESVAIQKIIVSNKKGEN